MCGRYTLTANLDDLQGRFIFEAQELIYKPRYNVAPTQPVLTIVRDGRNRAEYMRWGLIPSWAKDIRMGNRMINARAETVAGKPSFRRALQKRRCLIMADGFYEWKRNENGRVPIYIALSSRVPFGLAGLWETWKAPSGELVRSCTIITTTPNHLMERLHNRMPVILPRESEAVWLDQNIEDPGLLTTLLTPFPADDMEAYEVSTLVNSPANDRPDCVLPVG